MKFSRIFPITYKKLLWNYSSRGMREVKQIKFTLLCGGAVTLKHSMNGTLENKLKFSI